MNLPKYICAISCTMTKYLWPPRTHNLHSFGSVGDFYTDYLNKSPKSFSSTQQVYCLLNYISVLLWDMSKFSFALLKSVTELLRYQEISCQSRKKSMCWPDFSKNQWNNIFGTNWSVVVLSGFLWKSTNQPRVLSGHMFRQLVPWPPW